MKEKRGCAAAVMHNDKLHVFGGYSGSILQTTETINVDGEVSYGPDLPTGVSSHAMTKINDTVSLLSGGNYYATAGVRSCVSSPFRRCTPVLDWSE